MSSPPESVSSEIVMNLENINATDLEASESFISAIFIRSVGIPRRYQDIYRVKISFTE